MRRRSVYMHSTGNKRIIRVCCVIAHLARISINSSWNKRDARSCHTPNICLAAKLTMHILYIYTHTHTVCAVCVRVGVCSHRPRAIYTSQEHVAYMLCGHAAHA